jgi:LacI family transcriptional regulator
MPRRSTRQDVALAAGVSGATVSRVYNHPELVDTATLERVRSAAEALGFVPDKHAAALRRRSSATLLFLEIEDDASYRWPGQRAYFSLYGEIVRAVLHAVQTTPFTLQLLSLPANELSSLKRLDFAGILGFDVTEQRWADALAAFGRPVVCCHHGDHLTGVSTVTTDNRAGGALQAKYLTSLGHTSVAYVTSLGSIRSHQERWEGFREILPPVLTLDGFLGFADGQRAGREIAAKVRRGEITAFACVNDLTALGVIRELEAQGIQVPDDIAGIGYDNLLLDGLFGHALPTIDGRLPEVYARALNMLTTDTRHLVNEVLKPLLVASV